MVYIEDPYRKQSARIKRARGTRYFLQRDVMVLCILVPCLGIGYYVWRRIENEPKNRRFFSRLTLPFETDVEKSPLGNVVLPRSAAIQRLDSDLHPETRKSINFHADRSARPFSFTVEDVELPVRGPDGKFHIPIDNVQRICERNGGKFLTPKEPLPPSNLPKPEWMKEKNLSFTTDFSKAASMNTHL